jgi:hypothetical protein
MDLCMFAAQYEISYATRMACATACMLPEAIHPNAIWDDLNLLL